MMRHRTKRRFKGGDALETYSFVTCRESFVNSVTYTPDGPRSQVLVDQIAHIPELALSF